jgi:hypothetical protein
MAAPSEIQQQIVGKTDDELIYMIHRAEDWTPSALEMAQTELKRRNIDVTKELNSIKISEISDAELKASQPLKRMEAFGILILCFIGIIPGIFLAAFQASHFKKDGYTKKARQCWFVFFWGVGIWLLFIAVVMLIAALK